jgi:hypothetical protein
MKDHGRRANFTAYMSNFDAVHGSSTGTRVLWMWVLLIQCESPLLADIVAKVFSHH